MSSNDRYQWLFRKGPALSLSLNEEGHILDASDAWLTRFGYGRPELSQLRSRDIINQESARRII